MTFEEVLDQALAMLHRRQRVTYQTLKLQFALDDELLDALKHALLFAHSEVSDEDDRGLVWTGDIPDPSQNPQYETDRETQFQQLLLAVIGLFQVERRITYRALKYVLGLDDVLLNDIRKELSLRRLAVDEDDEVLVWTGAEQSPGQSESTLPMSSSTSEIMVPRPSVIEDRMASGMVTDPQRAEPAISPNPVNSVPAAERRLLWGIPLRRDRG